VEAHRRMQVQERSGLDRLGVPPELLRSAPRQVRPSAAGVIVLGVAIGLAIAAVPVGLALNSRARSSERVAALAVIDSVTSTAEVVGVRRRGGGNDRRSVVSYRYVVDGREYANATTMRRQDRDHYHIGSLVVIRYLASRPESSWMEGYPPGRRPEWPAVAVPAALMIAALVLVKVFLAQVHLLEYGRPALGVVTKIEKKRSDKGPFWRVHYEWTLLNGARRAGHYNDRRRQSPAVGSSIPIVYDRDDALRHSKYPLGLVALRGQ